MLDLYTQIKIQPTDEDMNSLASQYSSVMTAISKYYEYLEKTGVPTEESYLTHWLEKDYFPDYYEEINCFLHE